MHNLFTNWISDLLWPHRCLGCGVRGVPLCGDCLRAIPVRPAVDPLADAVVVMSGGALADTLSSAVWHLKYRNMPSLAAPLAFWLTGALHRMPQTATLMRSMPLLVPVPLHARRAKERGYNQAELLARSVSTLTAMSVASDVLVRIRNTPSQVVSAGRTERIANMAGAFCCIKPDVVCGRSILLVDDVCTTGATLVACANVLKGAGARTVAAVVVARA